MENKKVIIIISICTIVVLIILSYFVGNLFAPKTKPGENIKINPVEVVSEISESIYFPVLVNSQDAIFYLGNQGSKLKSYSLSDKSINDLFQDDILFTQKIRYSPDGQKALILVKNGDDYIYKTYDLKSKKVFVLNPQIDDADWLNNESVVVSATDEEKSFLGISAFNSQEIQKLNNLDFGPAIINLSPDKKTLILYQEIEGYGDNKLYQYSIQNNKLELIPDKWNLFGAVFSPDSQKFASIVIDLRGKVESVVITNLADQKQNQITLTPDLDKIIWRDNNRLLLTIKGTGGDQFYLVDDMGKQSDLIDTKFSDPFKGLDLDVANLMIKNNDFYFTSNDILYHLSLQPTE